MFTSCCSRSNFSYVTPTVITGGFISPFANYRTPVMNFGCCGSNWSSYVF